MTDWPTIAVSDMTNLPFFFLLLRPEVKETAQKIEPPFWGQSTMSPTFLDVIYGSQQFQNQLQTTKKMQNDNGSGKIFKWLSKDLDSPYIFPQFALRTESLSASWYHNQASLYASLLHRTDRSFCIPRSSFKILSCHQPSSQRTYLVDRTQCILVHSLFERVVSIDFQSKSN